MIAARRAPGAKDVRTKQPKVKTPKPPRVRKHRVAALRTKITQRRANRRQPVTPVALRRREMIAVTAFAAVAVLAVAIIGFMISFSHMFDWAQANGDPEWRARAFPLSVDGAIIAASLVLYTDSRAGRKADKVAYLITMAGLAWSVGANVAHDWVSPAAEMLIAVWPPVAMFLSVELLLRFARRTRGQADAEVRKAARRASAPTADADEIVPAQRPAPAPKPEYVGLTVQAARPSPAPKPEPQPSAMPSWVPVGANTKQACMAYLAQHPDADGIEVDREVGKHFQMSDGYARKQVREHKAQLAMLAEREG